MNYAGIVNVSFKITFQLIGKFTLIRNISSFLHNEYKTYFKLILMDRAMDRWLGIVMDSDGIIK